MPVKAIKGRDLAGRECWSFRHTPDPCGCPKGGERPQKHTYHHGRSSSVFYRCIACGKSSLRGSGERSAAIAWNLGQFVEDPYALFAHVKTPWENDKLVRPAELAALAVAKDGEA